MWVLSLDSQLYHYFILFIAIENYFLNIIFSLFIGTLQKDNRILYVTSVFCNFAKSRR